jgi:hypothetical protein
MVHAHLAFNKASSYDPQYWCDRRRASFWLFCGPPGGKIWVCDLRGRKKQKAEGSNILKNLTVFTAYEIISGCSNK